MAEAILDLVEREQDGTFLAKASTILHRQSNDVAHTRIEGKTLLRHLCVDYRHVDIVVDVIDMIVRLCPQTLADEQDLDNQEDSTLMEVCKEVSKQFTDAQQNQLDSRVVETLTLGGPLCAEKPSVTTGQLPLHAACYNVHPNEAVVATLCHAYPLAIGEQDKAGNTPLHCMVDSFADGHTTSISAWKTLIDLAPDDLDEITNHEGCSILLWLAKNSKFCQADAISEVIKLLHKKFPSAVKKINEKGETCLHLAVTHPYGHRSLECTIKVLLECDPKQAFRRDQLGRTPLHVLCMYVRMTTKDTIDVLCKAAPHALLVESTETNMIAFAYLDNRDDDDSIPELHLHDDDERIQHIEQYTLHTAVAMLESVFMTESSIDKDTRASLATSYPFVNNPLTNGGYLSGQTLRDAIYRYLAGPSMSRCEAIANDCATLLQCDKTAELVRDLVAIDKAQVSHSHQRQHQHQHQHQQQQHRQQHQQQHQQQQPPPPPSGCISPHVVSSLAQESVQSLYLYVRRNPIFQRHILAQECNARKRKRPE